MNTLMARSYNQQQDQKSKPFSASEATTESVKAKQIYKYHVVQPVPCLWFSSLSSVSTDIHRNRLKSIIITRELESLTCQSRYSDQKYIT